MSLYPEGENTRRAIRWISDRLREDASQPVMGLVHRAIAQFDLSPKEGQQLLEFYRGSPAEGDGDGA
jgi:hypothetical protein